MGGGGGIPESISALLLVGFSSVFLGRWLDILFLVDVWLFCLKGSVRFLYIRSPFGGLDLWSCKSE